MSEFGDSASSDASNDSRPASMQHRTVGDAFMELDRHYAAELARLERELKQANTNLAAAQAASQAGEKDHLAAGTDDGNADAEKQSPAELSPGESDNRDSEAMSEDVRQCPIFRRRKLPKPPRLPDDLSEDDIIAAARDVALSPAQKLALAALVSGHTALSAAHRAGVSPRTLYRWRQERTFNETLEAMSDSAMEASVTRMRTLLLRSTHVISASLLQSEKERWAMRLIACPQVWRMGRKPDERQTK